MLLNNIQDIIKRDYPTIHLGVGDTYLFHLKFKQFYKDSREQNLNIVLDEFLFIYGYIKTPLFKI